MGIGRNMKKLELINIIKKEILGEIKVRPPSPLNQLLDLKSKINASKDPKEKLSLAIQCAEKILFIFEEKYPDNKHPRQAIEAAKTCLANPTEENRKVAYNAAEAASNVALNTNYNKAASAAASAAYAAVNNSLFSNSDDEAFAAFAAEDAITAFEEYYNLNESKTLIKEYTEKTINDTITRWKTEDPKTDDNIAKQLIQRFDQIKSALSQKLDIVVLSDTLKQGQNYLNIDKYSYDDMIKLIKSLPENPEKTKKEAVEKFVKQEQIDKSTAQSYVARFMSNKDKLKYAVENGTEDEAFTKEEVIEFIPKNLLVSDSYLDPRRWKWQSFEQTLDALFPSQKKTSEEGENLVSTDANKIYDKDGIEIYKGDDVHKCISYNPISSSTKRKKYGWCVTQVGNTNYDYYRFGDKAPTFYFVFDRSKDSSPEHAPFKDKWHAYVIQVTADNKEYIVTGADNRGDIPTRNKGWEGIASIIPADAWAKIKNLKDYFKPIALSPVERGRKFAAGKNLSLSEFKELSQDEKILYIQGKGSKNAISLDILNVLPQYKINYEGRSTTLANIAMDSRQKFPYSILKDNEALVKRYAIVSARHFPNDPLPLPFIKYLDEENKQEYLKKYDNNLTVEYIEKYFGDKTAKDYVNKQLKQLKYLPPNAIKYIDNPKLKQLFNTYSKLFGSWVFSADTNMDEKQLESVSSMPEQAIDPVPLNQEQWTSLSTVERKLIMGLAEKHNQDLNYEELLFALPFIIKDGNQKYVFIPKSNSSKNYESWVIMDDQGKVINDNISGNSTLGGEKIDFGYPSKDSNYNRIYDIKDLKTTNDNISEFVKESLKEWFKLEKQWKN